MHKKLSLWKPMLMLALFQKQRIVSLQSVRLKKQKKEYDESVDKQHFDLAVIGGGSGGIQCSLAARRAGLKVVMLDYVQQSPQHNTWGLGGTCLNVGCIPKKLMHTAALYTETLQHMADYGIKVHQQDFSWQILVNNI